MRLIKRDFFTKEEIPIMTGRMAYLASMIEIAYDVKDNSDNKLNRI